ncbi:MAG TPA: hypothetical protein VF765_22995 [Polyangiaceae bacterium]
MVGRACRIGLLSLPLLEACGTGADFGVEADAAANAASISASGAGVATPESDTDGEARSIEKPCFHNPGPEAWTCNADGVTLTRTKAGATETVHCRHGCVHLPDGLDSQCRPRAGAFGSTVNGHELTAQQASWVSYFAWCAVPLLPGTRDVRLAAASTVAWWALKEGVLDESQSDPIGFSRCGAGRDHNIGPLERCAVGSAWQVGASGIQPSCCRLANLEDTAAALFSGMTEDQILSGAAVEAGYGVGSAEHARIVGSTGARRASWLLRVTAIGFFHQGPIVTEECIVKSHSWCYGTGWPTSASYAPDKPSAMRSMSDLSAILDALSP